jgi:SAM-dependent methyltransferase
LARRVAEIIDGIDRSRWEELRRRWAAGDGYTYRDHYRKYFDLERWLPGAVRAAAQAGLIECTGRSVLDIGCGAGLLGRVCRHLGHDHVGTDIGNPMFMEMCEALGVDCRTAPVERGQPMPPDLTDFDAIIALAANFYRSELVDGREVDNRWLLADWRLFLDDLRRRLRPGGIFLIKLNAVAEMPPEVLGHFQAHALTLDYNVYRFDRDRL